MCRWPRSHRKKEARLVGEKKKTRSTRNVKTLAEICGMKKNLCGCRFNEEPRFSKNSQPRKEKSFYSQSGGFSFVIQLFLNSKTSISKGKSQHNKRRGITPMSHGKRKNIYLKGKTRIKRREFIGRSKGTERHLVAGLKKRQAKRPASPPIPGGV